MKKKPKINKNKYIPKYDGGGESSSMMDDDQAFFNNNQNHNAGYNPADPNRAINTTSNVNYAQLGNAAIGAMSAYNTASNNNDGTTGDKRVAGTEAATEAGLTAGTGWYGYAKQASDIGKSFIARDDDGTAKTATGESFSRQMTATHTQAINSAKQGNYGMAAANILGMGNVMSMYGGIDNKSSFGKWTNKQLDNDHQYANGGISNNANAELEKQEVFKTPNGQIDAVNGAPHEQGGVPVNIPSQTKILSDKLKLNGKTFAKLGAKYTTNKEDKIISDDKASSTAKATAKLTSQIKQRKLDELFNAQESMKQSRLSNYAKKLGVTLPTQEFTYGGKSGKQAYDEDRQAIINENDFTTPELSTPNPYSNEMIYDPSKNYTGGSNFNYNRTADDLYNKERNQIINDNSVKPEKTNIPYEAIGGALLDNLGNIAYLKDQGKKYDKVNYGSVTPKLINYKEAIRQANQDAASSKNNLKNVVGGNAGAYMANLSGIQSTNTLNRAKIIEQGENINAGIVNQTSQFNKANEIQGMRDEAANKGQAATNYYKAIESIGRNTTQAYTDYKRGQMDANTAKMLSSSFANYGLDMNNPNHWTVYYKQIQNKTA